MGEPAVLEPRPGALLGEGRYRLDRLIGTGGMATVWRATDRRLGRPVAVKLIAAALAEDATYAARFEREARTAAGLSHANLVGVYDYGADERQPFLVMEYVDGGTLAERLERGPVRGEEAAAVAGDLLSALACIHAAGILHRDVKPANVLVSSDGRARLTDFGIAHPEDSTRLTQTGHLVGTLRYLAPEVIDGQPASRRSDLYALGVLLRDLAGDRDDPRTEPLVTQLTERTPARRPRTAEQARELLGGGSSSIGTVERKRPRLPATAPAPLAPARGAGSPGRRGSRDRVAAGRPGARRGRTRAAGIAAIAAACLAAVVVIVLASGGGNGGAARPASTAKAAPAPASSGRPGLNGRLDELERLVRAAGR